MAEPLILALGPGDHHHLGRSCSTPTGRALAEAGRPLEQHYPADGWVEHDAEAIFAASVEVLREVVQKAARPMAEVAAIGVTNQRETVVIWDRATGKPIHKAIVWQDRRTANPCERAARRGPEGGSPRSPACCSTRTSRAPRWPGCSTTWRRPASPGRHHRRVGDLEADRGRRPRHRCDQRLTYPALRHPRWGLVGRDGRDAEGPAGHPAGGARLRRRLRRDRPALLGRAIPIRGVAGDQQSALMGQGVSGRAR